MSEHPNIMISSTQEDLRAHIARAKAAVEQFGGFPLLMENLPASSQDAITASWNMVDKADIYVGVFAHRYGNIPDDPRNPNKVSITELEYRRATARGIPRLIFIMDDQSLVAAGMVEKGSGARKLERLKNELKQNLVVAFFKSPEDLGAKLLHALQALSKQTVLEVPVSEFEDKIPGSSWEAAPSQAAMKDRQSAQNTRGPASLPEDQNAGSESSGRKYLINRLLFLLAVATGIWLILCLFGLAVGPGIIPVLWAFAGLIQFLFPGVSPFIKSKYFASLSITIGLLILVVLAAAIALLLPSSKCCVRPPTSTPAVTPPVTPPPTDGPTLTSTPLPLFPSNLPDCAEAAANNPNEVFAAVSRYFSAGNYEPALACAKWLYDAQGALAQEQQQARLASGQCEHNPHDEGDEGRTAFLKDYQALTNVGASLIDSAYIYINQNDLTRARVVCDYVAQQFSCAWADPGMWSIGKAARDCLAGVPTPIPTPTADS